MTVRANRPAAALAALLLLVGAGAAGAQVSELPAGPDDTERVPRYTVVPDYPKVARRDRIEGEVQVCFNITRDGRPRRIAVRRSTHRIFEKPAIRAVRQSKYEPLPDEAELSGIKACRTFRFSLEPVAVDRNG